MKKFLGIVVLGLLWCNVGFAECIKGDCNNGYGTYTWPDGSKYVGEFKLGLFHGQGTLTYTDGRQYVGEFKDGIQHNRNTEDYNRNTEALMMFKANPQWPSTVDFGCLNMCKDAIKGMTIGEINSFCMMRCSIK